MNITRYDILIVGSGAAGLSLALKLADHFSVAILSKEVLHESATRYAQGGISAALADFDSVDSHVEDTLKTGVGLCHPEIVRYVAEQAKKSIYWLAELGVNFTREQDSNFHLNQEGGHAHRRILHVADSTGKAIQTTLESQVRSHHNIDLYEYHFAYDLIVKNLECSGCYVLNLKNKKTYAFYSQNTILATGGVGKVYRYTSNPDSATGDGIAMAWRAGCQISNMEFIQFHPTCLYHPDAKSFLLSEALRGEGAKLVLANDEQFMYQYDERAELSPRDVVSRAIVQMIKSSKDDCVYLDIRHQAAEIVKARFPTIYETCLQFGIDITRDKIPVVPAAHYSCGGIQIDEHGKTNIRHLYAIGEVSHSGLHGANRMASNSLLECLVFAHAAYADILSVTKHAPLQKDTAEMMCQKYTQSHDRKIDEALLQELWQACRRIMWDKVGIVRSTDGLEDAKLQIHQLKQKMLDHFEFDTSAHHLYELRNIITVSELIIQSALLRKESRGLHYNTDYPQTAQIKDTVISKNEIANV